MSDLIRIGVYEPVFGMYLGVRDFYVHEQSQCEGQHCCIHNPSDHRMADYEMRWRADIGIMERTCPHGVGHPDPDDAAFRATQGDHNTIHGCDGCCSSDIRN